MASSIGWSVLLTTLGLNILIAIYGIVYGKTLTKKLISLTILSDTVNLFFIFIGYRYVVPSIPPVLVELKPEYIEYLKAHGVDPLPQALVLTGIVIGMAVNSLIAFAIIQTYRLEKTVDARKLVGLETIEVEE
ncbi:MAG: sodium:proton antiporter [Desulfurococcaceae archaeon]